jgi:hypothetical protein
LLKYLVIGLRRIGRGGEEEKEGDEEVTGEDHRVARSNGWDETSSLADHDPREERSWEKGEILGGSNEILSFYFMFRSKSTKGGAFTVRDRLKNGKLVTQLHVGCSTVSMGI